MPYSSTGDVHLYYEREGQGPSLILLPGYTCSLNTWNLVRKKLSSHFDLILIDHRGVGRTRFPISEFTLRDMAIDVLNLIKNLSLSSPHILGHSMGGMIAQELARLEPQGLGKMILAQTGCAINPVTKAVLQTDLRFRKQNLPIRFATEAMMPWLFSAAFLANPLFCEAFLNTVEKDFPSLDGQETQARALVSFNSHSWCSEIQVPCLICVGEKDLLIPPVDALPLLEQIQGAVFHSFPDMGHMAPVEIPDLFCQMVVDFLSPV